MTRPKLAKRRTDPQSRRSILIFLTEKGREKAIELGAVVQAVNDAVLSPLCDVEKDDVVKLLQKVEANSTTLIFSEG